jgi:copper chaperone CopZ
MIRVALALALAACSHDEAPPPKPTAPKLEPARPAQLAHVTIKALGMNCEESCPIAVRTALADVPAVYELGFDLDHESVFISYDATLGEPRTVMKPVLVAIRGAGFDPWVAKESWPADAKAKVVKR